MPEPTTTAAPAKLDDVMLAMDVVDTLRHREQLVSRELAEGERDDQLLERLLATQPKNLDPAHAFYLGFEMCKAATALMLGKQYNQDQTLDWGAMVLPADIIEYKKHR